MKLEKTKVLIATGKVTRNGNLRIERGNYNDSINPKKKNAIIGNKEFIGKPIEVYVLTEEEIGGDSEPVKKESNG